MPGHVIETTEHRLERTSTNLENDHFGCCGRVSGKMEKVAIRKREERGREEETVLSRIREGYKVLRFKSPDSAKGWWGFFGRGAGMQWPCF
jgi:hypothetical protein